MLFVSVSTLLQSGEELFMYNNSQNHESKETFFTNIK